MKTTGLFALCFLAFLPFMLASCVTSVDLVEVIQGASDRDRKLLPETEWNKLGIWQRVAEQPATYIPHGYGVSAPRGESDGKWFVDKRDGKRLFVPNSEVGEFSNGVLVGEATKIVGQGSRQYLYTRPGIMVVP